MTSSIPSDLIAGILLFSPGFIIWGGFFVFRSLADRSVGRRPKFLDSIGWQRDYPHFLRLMGWLCLGLGALYIALLLSAVNVGLAPLDLLPSPVEAIVFGFTFVALAASAVSFIAGKRTSGRKSDWLNFIGLLLAIMGMGTIAVYQLVRDGLPFVD